MECAHPRIFNGIKCPCGQCMPCRINNRRLWTGRIVMESYCHDKSVFITFTYDPEYLPSDESVSKREAQLLLKRIRKAVYPRKIRYFIVGEYGEKSLRPHYHAVLFGLGLEHKDMLEKCWGKGYVCVGEVTPASASYTCGYCCKKLTSSDDPRLPSGRNPEFTLKSKGLGKEFILKISETLCTRGVSTLPKVVRISGKFYPLGRYLKGLLIKHLHLENIWESHLDELKKEVRTLLCDFQNFSEDKRFFIEEHSQKLTLIYDFKLHRIVWRKIQDAYPLKVPRALEDSLINAPLEHNCVQQYKNSLLRRLL